MHQVWPSLFLSSLTYIEKCPMQATGETSNRSGHSNYRCQGAFSPFFLSPIFNLFHQFVEFPGGAEGHKHAEWEAGKVFLRDLHGDESQDKEQGALCGAQHGPSKVSLPNCCYYICSARSYSNFQLSSKCLVKILSDILFLAVEC